jgi:hypothetical protein
MARARAANNPADEWLRARSEMRKDVGEDMGGEELPSGGGNAGLGCVCCEAGLEGVVSGTGA